MRLRLRPSCRRPSTTASSSDGITALRSRSSACLQGPSDDCTKDQDLRVVQTRSCLRSVLSGKSHAWCPI
jgi:hypothetical protein